MGQSRFRAALLDPDSAVPAGLTDPAGRPAGKRFDVYRNNVAASLTAALETGFPVLRKLLGADAFTTLAGHFLRAHPPASPLLARYGDRMPGFLTALPQLSHLPYLADVARLELALRQSYHAADAAPMDTDGLDPQALMGLCPRPAPATLVLASAHPILSIWRYNMVAGAPKPQAGAETVLIARPGFDPMLHLLPQGGAELIRALDGRTPIAVALERVSADTQGADIATLLTVVLTSGALTQDQKDPRR